MSMTIASIHPKPCIKLFSPKSPLRIHNYWSSFPLATSVSVKSLDKLCVSHCFRGPFKRAFRWFPLTSCGLVVKARQNENGSQDDIVEKEIEGPGPSSMPERFRYLTKEAPDKPIQWPGVIVLGFMLYAWRSVLWEFSNWSKAIKAIGGFFIYISKLAQALIFHFIGDPITSFIWLLETTFYKIRSIYSAIIAYAPIRELILIIIFTSLVMSVAEATVPDSVNSQPYLLTVAGLVSFGAVANFISEPVFWTLLLGLFSFAKVVKKRDYIASALPAAAALAAVGEPWIRAVSIGLYMGLAMFYHHRNGAECREDEDTRAINRVPFPLLCTAFAIGIRVAANWAGYRHLTWMVA